MRIPAWALSGLASVAASSAFVATVALFTAAPAEGQERDRPGVFFDCEGRNCNSEYFRTEIDWVNWVNDQAVGDVHVIVTSTQTGAGGREY
ncbi:MAG: hypothetical protein R3253_17500, partial [Longimicrobiales bacterium]|nr:hypothetical protein [Longimicrobiales bacterium]